MALQKQVVSVPFNQGLDTKTDAKLVLPGKLLTLENGVFLEGGKIRKRYGQTTLGNTVLSTGSSITTGKSVAAYNNGNLNNELVMCDQNTLYTYNQFGDNWISKGELVSASVAHETILRNTYQQTIPDAAYNQGVTVYAWKDSRGGVRASVIDESESAQIQSDVLVDASGDIPRVVACGNNIFIFYRNGTNVQFKAVGIGNPGSFGITGTIISDLNNTAGQQNYDVTTLGGNMVFAYNNNANNIKLLYINSAGVANPTNFPAAVTVAEAARNCIGIYVNAGNSIFVAYHNNTNGVRCFGRDNGFGQIFAPVTLDADTTNNYVNITGVMSNNTASAIRWYYEQSATSTYNTLVKHNTVSLTGTPGSTAVYFRSVGLASKAFQQGGKSYVGLVFDSTLQATYFVASETGKICARFKAGASGGLRGSPTLPQCFSLSTTKCAFANNIKTKIVTQNNTNFTIKGINKTSLDFGNAYSFKMVQGGQNLHIVGGVLYDYDGAQVVEHGFNVFPENITFDSTAFTIAVTQQGDGTHPEITNITLPAAPAITGGQYFLIDSTTTTFYVWFKKDGVGADPAIGGRTGLQINIVSTDTGNSVASKTATVMDARAELITPQPAAGSSTITNTNVANGAVTDAVNGAGNLGVGVGGTVTTGTFLYYIVYSWIDAKGQIHRSTPSTGNTVVVGGSNNLTVSVLIPTLRLTSKSNVVIEVYRTQNNGTIPYKLTSITSPLFNDTTVDLVTFADTATDASIASNEILYTTGGIVPNIAPPSCSIAILHKNRLFLKADEQNTIWYSRSIRDGEGVSFSDLLTLQVDRSQKDITALGSIDNNLIIYKQFQIRAIGGDGPNDSGLQNDFTIDQLLNSDTGCIGQDSVVNFDQGTIFKGDKGLYSLSRSLSVSYIGAPVESFNSKTITSGVLVPNTNQIRFTTSDSNALVYDYFFGQWSTFTNYQAQHACVWNNTYIRLKSDGTVWKEVSGSYTDNSNRIIMKIGTAWIKVADIQGFQRVYRAMLLGEFRSDHTLSIGISYDYQTLPVYYQTWSPSSIINTNLYGSESPYGSLSPYGGPADNIYQVLLHTPVQKCQSIQFTFQDIIDGAAGIGESYSISSLALYVGVKQGMNKVKSAKQIG